MPSSLRTRFAMGVAIAAILALTICLFRWEGRLWWCACGAWYPWSSNVLSEHNSQHFFDPYSITHVLHGFLFCGVLTWMLRRLRVGWRFVIAVAAEAIWEIVENTDFIIDRYRTATAAFDYRGDTVANSLGDIISAMLGFALARRLGLRWSIIVYFVTEIVLLMWIHDGLFVNLLMLIHPIESIKAWQLG